MSIAAYTTFNDVRAALGVTPKDLADDTLALSYYEDSLLEGLDNVHPSLIQSFNEANSADPQSSAQARLTRSVRLLATLVVAKAAIPAMRMAAPQQVSDGKATLTRFTDPLVELERGIDKNYAQAKNRVEAALEALLVGNKGTTARVYFSVVSPGVDPVTGT